MSKNCPNSVATKGNNKICNKILLSSHRMIAINLINIELLNEALNVIDNFPCDKCQKRANNFKQNLTKEP